MMNFEDDRNAPDDDQDALRAELEWRRNAMGAMKDRDGEWERAWRSVDAESQRHVGRMAWASTWCSSPWTTE